MWFRQLCVYCPEMCVVFVIFCGCVFFFVVAIAVSLFSFIVIFLHAHTFLLTFVCMCGGGGGGYAPKLFPSVLSNHLFEKESAICVCVWSCFNFTRILLGFVFFFLS